MLAFSHLSLDEATDIQCIYAMSANSSSLFLLPDEAHQTGKRREQAPEAPEVSPGDSEVIAGNLRVRWNAVLGSVEQIRSRRAPIALVSSQSEDSSNYSEWFDAISDHPETISNRNLGFLDHLRQYVCSILMIFLSFGIVIGIAGICSFYFGVMLPFGLG